MSPDIESGDLLLFRGTAWYSRLIRYHTQSVYSHAGIAYKLRVNGSRRLCIFEAYWGQGFRLYPLDVYLEECVKTGTQVDWYRLDDSLNREHVAAKCWTYWARTKYPWLFQLVWSFGLLAKALRRRFGWRADLSSGGFCSEMAARIYQECGYIPSGGDPVLPEETEPGALARYTIFRPMGPITHVEGVKDV